MELTSEKALELLLDAKNTNPGAWVNHSLIAAHCAREIAKHCEDLAEDKAYALGLIHDLGRKFGQRHLGHVIDGYSYLLKLGFSEAAQICLTHSFHHQSLEGYIGEVDVTKEELHTLTEALSSAKLTDYDRLIQLCDALAGASGVLDIEERMNDVKQRYGRYPNAKWDYNLALKEYFEKKIARDIYEVVGQPLNKK